MSKENEELHRAFDLLLEAISNLEVGGWQAGFKAAASAPPTVKEPVKRVEPAVRAAPPSAAAKGKAKDPNPDWEDVPYNPVPITPLSRAPRFAQVVGSPPSSSSLAGPSRPVIGSAVAAMAARSPAGGQGGQGGPGGNPPQQQPPLAYQTGDAFNQMWDNIPTDVGRQALEQTALNRGNQQVQFAAMLKYNLRLQGMVGQLTNQVAQAQQTAQAANVAAVNAAAQAQAAGNVDRFRPAAPPKFGNKAKDAEVRQWLPVIEDYLRTAPDQDYIRLASSYLEGGPRSLWTSVYEAYRTAHAAAPEPPNPRQFFRQTMEQNYGLQDLEQKYWDTWEHLRQGPSQDINEYNISFQQALTDLAASITDEQVKIEKYRSGLQFDLRQLCRTSPAGTRWARLADIIQYATLQWPVIQERIAKKKKSAAETTKVGGKRKASGGSGGSGSNRPSGKARLGILSDEQKKKDMDEKLCHICHQPGHQQRQCPNNPKNRVRKGKVAAVSGKTPPTDMSEDEEDF